MLRPVLFLADEGVQGDWEISRDKNAQTVNTLERNIRKLVGEGLAQKALGGFFVMFDEIGDVRAEIALAKHVLHERPLLLSGSNLGNFEENELIFVKKCRVEDELVLYHGPIKPSSESIMHWLIYKKRPEAAAVIHAHDEFATCSELLVGEIEESNREEPYGSVEIANMAIEMFSRAEKIFVLKNHGYIAVGPDLDSTSDLVVDTHLRLLKKRGY